MDTDPETTIKYPKATPIWRLESTYSCSKKDFEVAKKQRQFNLRNVTGQEILVHPVLETVQKLFVKMMLEKLTKI